MTRESEASPLPIEAHSNERLIPERLPRAFLVAAFAFASLAVGEVIVDRLATGDDDCVQKTDDISRFSVNPFACGADLLGID